MSDVLDDRKLKILAAVVSEYILTGEPVGSKAVAKTPGIRVSSATIRNDMALLEQLGYLEQPHTSAGRIPTYRGIKLYIEQLMPEKPLSDEQRAVLDRAIEADGSSEEAIIENAAHALAEITNCTVAAADMSPQFSVIAKVEAIPTGKRMYVLLMITSSGNIRNKVCRLEFDLTHEQIDFFTEYMTEHLSGVAVDSLSESAIEKLAEAMGAYTATLSPLLQGVGELARSFMTSDVHVKGEKNLLARNDIGAEDVIRFLDQKNNFARLLDSSFGGLQVLFGEDDSIVISNSSMIVSPFKKDGRTVGSLSVIGPVRLDYATIIPYIEYITGKISSVLSSSIEDETRDVPEITVKDSFPKGDNKDD